MSSVRGQHPFDASVFREPEGKAVALLAATVGGWAMTQLGNGPVVFASNDHPGIQFQVPTDTTVRESVFKQWVNKVMRYGRRPSAAYDPAVTGAIADTVGLNKAHARLLRKIVEGYAARAEMPDLSPTPAPVRPEPSPVPPPAREEAPVGPVAQPDQAPEAEPEPKKPKKQVKRSRIPQPEWVFGPARATRPWLAHAEAGGMYESKAVNEVELLDGRVVYECRHPGCGRRDTKPLAVSAHYGYHTRAAGGGTQPINPVTAYDPGWTPAPTDDGRRQARIDRLAAELYAAEQHALDNAAPGESVTLGMIAAAVIDRRIQAKMIDDDAEPTEPPTAEELLGRIAALVDRGMTPRLVDRAERAEAALAEATAEMAALAEIAATERERRESLERNVGALRALVDELAVDDPTPVG